MNGKTFILNQSFKLISTCQKQRYLYFWQTTWGGGGGGATLLNPLKIKPHIADFYIHLGGLRGLNPPKITPPFDFLTPNKVLLEKSIKDYK